MNTGCSELMGHWTVVNMYRSDSCYLESKGSRNYLRSCIRGNYLMCDPVLDILAWYLISCKLWPVKMPNSWSPIWIWLFKRLSRLEPLRLVNCLPSALMSSMTQTRLTLVLSLVTLVPSSPSLARVPSTLCQCCAGLYTPTRSLPRYHWDQEVQENWTSGFMIFFDKQVNLEEDPWKRYLNWWLDLKENWYPDLWSLSWSVHDILSSNLCF